MIAYIRHISPSEAGGRLAHVYREIRHEVPRVPNMMQVFSLRPETMSCVYRSWLASMWTGNLSRQMKELLGVVVSTAARSAYGADTHMVFLRAAGMDSLKAFQVEELLDDAPLLNEAERAAVRYAYRATVDPRGVDGKLLAALMTEWPDDEQRYEIVALVAQFSALFRIANALGVSAEIPSRLRKYRASRRHTINVLSRFARLSVDFADKSFFANTPEENRQLALTLFCSALGFSEPPAGLEALEVCPEIFDAQTKSIEKSIAVLPRDRWMRMGLVVGRLNGCEYLANQCRSWLERAGWDPEDVISAGEGGEPTTLTEAEKACLRYVRDLTLHSHTINQRRIDSLRNVGLSDGAILDVAYVAGVQNGLVRLVLGYAPTEFGAAA